MTERSEKFRAAERSVEAAPQPNRWEQHEPSAWLPNTLTTLLRRERAPRATKRRWDTAAAVLAAFLVASKGHAEEPILPAGAPVEQGGAEPALPPLPPEPIPAAAAPSAEVAVTAEPERPATERLGAAFAMVNDQRSDPRLLATVSQEQLDRAATIVGRFPFEKVATAVSEVAGVEAGLVLQQSHLETVALYSPRWLDANSRRLASSGHTEVPADVQALWDTSGGFSALDGKFIGINVDYIHQIAREEQFDQAIRETTLHEFFHTLPSDSFDEATAPARTDLDWLVYEGITQALTITVMEKLLPQGEVLDTAYQTGIKQAGYLVVETLGPELVYQAYVNDRAEDIVAAWNAKFGAGSWERAMSTSFGLSGEDQERAPVKDMYALYGLLKEMGPQAKAAYLKTNGAMENSHILAFFSADGTLEGVYVRDDRLTYPIPAGLAVMNYPLPDGRVETYILPHVSGDTAVTGRGARYEGRPVSVSRITVPPTSMALVGPLTDGQVTRFLQARVHSQVETDLRARGLLPPEAPEAPAVPVTPPAEPAPATSDELILSQ